MNLLLLLLIVPLAGAVVCALVPSAQAKFTAMVASLATAVAGLAVVIAFYRGGQTDLLFGYGIPALSLPALNLHFTLRADALSVWLIALTCFMAPLALAASFASIQQRQKQFYVWMLVLLMANLGVFMAADMVLFYLFFELTLAPMFFVIGMWGGASRQAAASKYFLYTFTGSLFTLASTLYLGMRYQTFDISQLIHAVGHGLNGASALSYSQRMWVVLGLLAGFAVKTPLFPVHTWVGLVYGDSPRAVILSGVLLKLGPYGLLRLALPLGLNQLPTVITAIAIVCVIGIIYGALIAWTQRDMKRLIAYGSVSHLGLCVLGLVALNPAGLQGGVLYMINHAVSTAGLLLCIGMIHDRYQTSDMHQLSGLARRMPKLSFFFVLFALSSIGLPGLNGFVSEFLTTLGAFTSPRLGPQFGSLAALGVILGAIYTLHMLARVVWGPLKTPEASELASPALALAGAGVAGSGQPRIHGGAIGHGALDRGHLPKDIGGREVALLIPLAIVVALLGVWPTPLLQSLRGPLEGIRTANIDAGSSLETPILNVSNVRPGPATPAADLGLIQPRDRRGVTMASR